MIKSLTLYLIALSCLTMPLALMADDSLSPNLVPPLKKKMKIPTIVIDPGHGGQDHGATSSSGILEKKVCLDIANRTTELLKQMGFEVVMTRTDDQFIPLGDRVKFCEQHQGDLFVSIHANAAPNKKATGFETFVLSPNKEAKGIEKYGGFFTYLSLNSRGKKSLKLAKLVQAEMLKSTGSENRGIKMAKFRVLHQKRVPAVLVETGFLSNKEEASNLNSPEYCDRIASALAKSVRRYCRF